MDAPQTPTPTQPAKRTWPIFVGTFALFALFAGFVQWMLATSDRAAFDEEAIRALARDGIDRAAFGRPRRAQAGLSG
jgi:cbb3-type cytochrome oxidase subunit 3